MASKASTTPRILIYLLRRDLRLADNNVLHEIAQKFNSDNPPFTHLLPIYVYPANQVEVSGFIPEGSDAKSPFPEARSAVAGFWRCGPHRVRFVTESLFDLKKSLQSKGSGLVMRAGKHGDVLRDAFKHLEKHAPKPSEGVQVKSSVVGVWMVREEGHEEKIEESDVQKVAEEYGSDFRLFDDAKYYLDEKDLPFDKIQDLPNVFTAFRNKVEPLRERPSPPLPRPSKLPPFPDAEWLPPQSEPFKMPEEMSEVIAALNKPFDDKFDLENPPKMPESWSKSPNPISAMPFRGGEAEGLKRLDHLFASGSMTDYKDTRNGLLGQDFSTKLSAWLAMGCITSRQIQAALLDFEEGDAQTTNSQTSKEDLEERRKRAASWKGTKGFGKGENKGTAAIRFELLWRDYFRLYTRKFGPAMFYLEGVKEKRNPKYWKQLKGKDARDGTDEDRIVKAVNGFRSGQTGTGLVDASQRELFLTGYTSNRARQNVTSFLAKHLEIDWRIGAEWYECMLLDYDVGSNWGNWQYVAGVGNDPRQDRIFNPIKQASDYDKKGDYIRTWVPELRDVPVEYESGKTNDTMLMGVYQAWKLPDEEKKRLGLQDKHWVQEPLKKIEFTLGRKPRPDRKGNRGGGGKGPRGGGNWRGSSVNAPNTAPGSG